MVAKLAFHVQFVLHVFYQIQPTAPAAGEPKQGQVVAKLNLTTTKNMYYLIIHVSLTLFQSQTRICVWKRVGKGRINELYKERRVMIPVFNVLCTCSIMDDVWASVLGLVSWSWIPVNSMSVNFSAIVIWKYNECSNVQNVVCSY